MTASAQDITARLDAQMANARVLFVTTTLATKAEDGAIIYTGFSSIYHVSVTEYATTATDVISYAKDGGTVTLYGKASGPDAATVTVAIFGAD